MLQIPNHRGILIGQSFNHAFFTGFSQHRDTPGYNQGYCWFAPAYSCPQGLSPGKKRMNIIKLNCTACGAPIQIGEDDESLNCPCCSTFFKLEYGTGYSALKVLKETGSVVEKNNKRTQYPIQENTLAMCRELRRNQLITLETLLNICRSEIRPLELQAGTPAIHIQLTHLQWEEYKLLEKIKKEQVAICELEPVLLVHNMPFMQAQVAILDEELAVLAKLAQTPGIIDRVQSIEAEKTEWACAIFDFGVLTIEQNLSSFNTNLTYYESLAILEAEIESVCKDFDTVSKMKPSPELDLVEKELREKYAELVKNWEILEERRINGGLHYDWAAIVQIDQAGIIRAIKLIDQDLTWLHSQKTNHITDERTQKLCKRREELEGWQKNLDWQAAWRAPGRPSGAANILAGTGIGTAWSALTGWFSPLPNPKDPEIPTALKVSPVDLPPASTKPIQWIMGIVILMLFPALITFVFFIGGTFVLGTAGPDNPTALNFTLTGQAVGVVLGCIGFFLSIVPGASIWPVRVRQLGQVMNRSDKPLPMFRQYGTGFKLIAITLAGTAVVVNSFFVMVVISSWFNNMQPTVACFAPLITLPIFVFVLTQKMKSPI